MSKEQPIKTINYRGQIIEIFREEQPLSPDDWGNDDCFIIYDHRNFCVEREGFNASDVYEAYKEKQDYNGYKLYPLFAYIHSGVSLSLSRKTDPWDTSFKGFVLAKNDLPEIDKVVNGMVEVWNEYLSGQVYGFVTEKDSCWGFYGEEGIVDAIEEGKACIDLQINKLIASRIKKLKKWIKNKVPFIYRKPFEILT